MSGKREYEKHFDYMSIIGVVIIMANLYYYAHPLLRSMGATVDVIDLLFLKLREGGIFNSSLLTKGITGRTVKMMKRIRKGANIKYAVLLRLISFQVHWSFVIPL